MKLALSAAFAAAVVVACLAAAGAFGRLIGRFLAVDVVVMCRLLAESLVRLASRRIPSAHRERYRDEWLGELDALRREHDNEAALSLILFAIRILVGSGGTGRAIGSATLKSRVAPSASSPEQGGRDEEDTFDYFEHDIASFKISRESEFIDAIIDARQFRVDPNAWEFLRASQDLPSFGDKLNGELIRFVDLLDHLSPRDKEENL